MSRRSRSWKAATRRLNTALERGVIALYQLVRALASREEPLEWWLITRGGRSCQVPLSTLRPSAVAAEQAPVWGFGQVISQEYPHWTSHALDLPAGDDDLAAEALADQVEQELLAGMPGGAALRQEAAGNWQRLELAVLPFDPRIVPERLADSRRRGVSDQRRPRQHRTGAARGLAEQGAGTLVLLSRHALPADRAGWLAQHDPQDPIAGQLEKLAALEGRG